MNTIELLKTLRIRDKEIAKTLGVQVAQLNRRQNKLQQPSEESKTQLKNYARGLIHHLQVLIFEEDETELPTNIPIETTNNDSQEIPDDTKPLSEDIQEEQPIVKTATKTKKK